jgi:hypothetical protein
LPSSPVPTLTFCCVVPTRMAPLWRWPRPAMLPFAVVWPGSIGCTRLTFPSSSALNFDRLMLSGQAQCDPCSPGSYSDVPEQTECTKCKAGLISSNLLAQVRFCLLLLELACFLANSFRRVPTPVVAISTLHVLHTCVSLVLACRCWSLTALFVRAVRRRPTAAFRADPATSLR